MKNIISLLVLICSVAVIIVSCAKKEESTTAAASTLDPPTCPSDNTDCITAGWHQNELDWNAVSGATSYTIYWSTSTGVSSSSTAITGITDDNYTHTGLDNGTTYYYKGATVNSAGTGSLSDESSATPRTGPTVTEACTFGEAASGTVSGLKGANASGTFYHSFGGADYVNSDGCTDNSSAISAVSVILASGSKGFRHAAIIQGNGNAYMDSWSFYMGDNCTKQSGFMSFYHDNLTVGDNITIANPSSGYPEEATKVLYKNSYACILAETASQETTLETMFQGGVSLTVGTVFDQPNGTVGAMDNNTVLWTVLDNISGQSINWFYSEDNEIANTYPDNFTDPGGATAWHAGDNITR